jgi:hypothetical protein
MIIAVLVYLETSKTALLIFFCKITWYSQNRNIIYILIKSIILGMFIKIINYQLLIIIFNHYSQQITTSNIDIF